MCNMYQTSQNQEMGTFYGDDYIPSEKFRDELPSIKNSRRGVSPVLDDPDNITQRITEESVLHEEEEEPLYDED